MAKQTSVLVEQPVVAFALGHPGFGPSRLWAGPDRGRAGQAQVGRDHAVDQWGLAGAGSPPPVHSGQALWLVAGYAAPPEPQRPQPAPERHLEVDHPGQLVQLDCFCIGRLSGTKGTLWQSTAIDVASASTWATLQMTRRNPSATWTSALARQVAAELASRGWKLERVMSDNASEFRSATFRHTVAKLGARQSFIRAGRPQTNGGVERVQQTILEEAGTPPSLATSFPSRLACAWIWSAISATQHRASPHRPLDPRPHLEAVLGKAKLWQKNR
jgi:transposase InsO family protein